MRAYQKLGRECRALFALACEQTLGFRGKNMPQKRDSVVTRQSTQRGEMRRDSGRSTAGDVHAGDRSISRLLLPSVVRIYALVSRKRSRADSSPWASTYIHFDGKISRCAAPCDAFWLAFQEIETPLTSLKYFLLPYSSKQVMLINISRSNEHLLWLFMWNSQIKMFYKVVRERGWFWIRKIEW